MTVEMAAFYRRMLSVGLSDTYQRDIGLALEREDPLSELLLELAFCLSDVKLDALIRTQIPCGREVRKEPHALNDQIDLTVLRCSPYVNLSRAQRSIGTLGGGNHFIEVDRGANGDLFIVVHSGSRHIGNEVAKYYQDEGRKAFWGGARHQVDAAVAELKAQGRFQEIQSTINRLRKEHEIALPKDLAYVEGRLFDDYIHDMKIIQQFATLNRKAMMDVIVTGMGLTPVEQFTTIHTRIPL